MPTKRSLQNLKRGGSAGRPRGARNVVPAGLKASVRVVLVELAEKNQDDIRAAFLKGINARPPHSLRYLEVIAHYVDGKPADTVNLRGNAIVPPLQVFLHPDGIESGGDE